MSHPKPHPSLIVPGFNGSGPDHWQSWIETQIPGARRLRGVDWADPKLEHWAAAVRAEIDQTRSPMWIVAHSFGCLATITALGASIERVAGVMLVAPADPERFTPHGLRGEDGHEEQQSVAHLIPRRALDLPGIVVASTNDPWVRLSSAAYWANVWGFRLAEIGAAGHINVDSGHGPWPHGLALFQSLQAAGDLLHGTV